MGWGDYIMTTGIVRRLKIQNPNLQVLIKEPYNDTRQYKDIFYNNPYITSIDSFNNKLPYVKVPRVLAGINNELNDRIIWKKERVAEVGDLYTKKEEEKFAEDSINAIFEHWKIKNKKLPRGLIFLSDTAKKNIILNNKIVKYEHYVNKEWGRNKWEEFIKITSKDYILIKTTNSKDNTVEGLYSILCDFRTNYAIMKKCDFYVGNEGGLSHLWAITRKRAIVFFGHWIPPYVTGYPFHLNLTKNTNDHCGSLKKCKTCINFFKDLEPEYIKFILEKNI